MNNLIYQIMLPLLAAHFISDFIFQSDNDVKKKVNNLVFGKHILIVTALSYLFTGLWTNLFIPITIFVSHAIIDMIKRSVKKDSLSIFLIDQATHIIIILLLAYFIGKNISYLYWYQTFGLAYYQAMVLITAIILSTKFSSIIISFIITPFQDKIFEGEPNGIKTGRIIGYLERMIIMILFLAEIPAMIGFLITAKSILRYGEIKTETDKKMIEYVLIGTLLSFSFGIAIGFITVNALRFRT